MSDLRRVIEEALAASRTKSSWNDRLRNWEMPASQTEVVQIERAASMVGDVLDASAWFVDRGLRVEPQGSYFNNTNVRNEADMDLRVAYEHIRVDYDASVTDKERAYEALGYVTRDDLDFATLRDELRSNLVKVLNAKFGSKNVDPSGKKAIRVHELPGSRADIDVVPAFTLSLVGWSARKSAPIVRKGIAIFGTDDKWTKNYPDQHHANGIAKRARTAHRFKKVVRALKSIRDELVLLQTIPDKSMPSFLIECLVYGVEDHYFFAGASHERFDRLVQIIERVW